VVSDHFAKLTGEQAALYQAATADTLARIEASAGRLASGALAAAGWTWMDAASPRRRLANAFGNRIARFRGFA
jgi:hypothetical protein